MATIFESNVCSRCGGSKVFTCWSHIQGGACFKCGGRGYILTKRGAAAAAFFNSLRTFPIGELKVGDLIERHSITNGGSSFSEFARVEEIRLDYAQFTRTRSYVNGEEVPSKDRYVITTDKKGRKQIQYMDGVEGTFLKGLSKEEKAPLFEQALAYQETLLQNGKPRKRQKVAV